MLDKYSSAVSNSRGFYQQFQNLSPQCGASGKDLLEEKSKSQLIFPVGWGIWLQMTGVLQKDKKL